MPEQMDEGEKKKEINKDPTEIQSRVILSKRIPVFQFTALGPWECRRIWQHCTARTEMRFEDKKVVLGDFLPYAQVVN